MIGSQENLKNKYILNISSSCIFNNIQLFADSNPCNFLQIMNINANAVISSCFFGENQIGF